jgi:ABC-type bacteriocin/lantibiotic exporter with double-glycine peptidase domain
MVTWAIVSLNQDISQYFPVIAMFAAAGMRIGPSAAVLTGGVSQLRQAAPAISDLAKDLRGNRGGPGPKSGASCSNQEVFESLKLSNISFRYPGTCEDVLRDISLQIRSGDCIGIMGPSGSGKTTLVDVFLELLIPTAGAIYVNRKSLSHNPKTWAGMVAYLPQENFLIDDSIERNVTLSEMMSDGEKDNVSRNLRDAQILEAVKKFPEGVHTRVGEGGGRLSGGQRQRISIARAFYFKRDVLIFDEATSALDNDTEREIIAEIQKLKGKSTLIVIAHRASTLKVCDRVYRLSNGHLSPHSGTI